MNAKNIQHDGDLFYIISCGTCIFVTNASVATRALRESILPARCPIVHCFKKKK